MAIGTVADDIEPGHERAYPPRFSQISRTAWRTAIKPSQSSSRLLFLVRHADAGDKHRWQGPDSLRPLSLAGEGEAAGLVFGLDDYPIWRILTSPTLRCHQTVQPLARDRRLRIEREPAFGVDADLAPVLALLQDPRLQDTVVCTHGEVIGQVLTRLVTDGLAVDQPLRWPKGSTWLLDGANGRLPTPATCLRWSWPQPRASHRDRGPSSVRQDPALGQAFESPRSLGGLSLLDGGVPDTVGRLDQDLADA